MINIQLRRKFPNGDVLSYQYVITEIEAEKLDDLGKAFEDFFAQMKAEYTKVYTKVNKEQDFGQ